MLSTLSRSPLRRSIGHGILSSAAAAIAAILLAGAPLLVSTGAGGARFSPERIGTAFLSWVGGLAYGSSFTYIGRGGTSWNLLDSAPSYLLVSFMNLALPGIVALFLGIVLGLSFEAERRAGIDRALRFIAATPDFLLALLLQSLVLLLVPLGIHVRIGPSHNGFSSLAFLVMGVYPLVYAFRATVFAATSVKGEEWIAAARARGLSESSIRRRHVGAAVLLSLRTELPVIVAAMQGTLFIVEYQFNLPGIARFLFKAAFSGSYAGWFFSYQYDLGLFVLLSLIVVCAAVQGLFSLTLGLARRVVAGE